MNNSIITDRPDLIDTSSASTAVSQNSTHSRGSGVDSSEGNSLWSSAKQALTSFASVSEFLRLLGCIGVLLSMSLFLLQGWAETNDFQRFCMMVAQTVLLSFAGFSMYKWLRETKSARLFFGLSLVSVTVNFTTLGALIYSVFAWDNLSVNYPQFAHWVASDVGSVLLSMVLAAVILAPLAWLAFSILVRPAAKMMTLAYIAMNLLLLLPIRETGITVVLAIVAAAALVKYLSSHLRAGDLTESLNRDSLNTGVRDLPVFSWRTREAKFAQLTLFLPLTIMLVRGFMHYDVDTFSIIAIAASIYVFAVYSANVVAQRFASVFYSLALGAALVMATQLAFVSGWATGYLQLPLFALVFCAAIVDVFRRTQSKTLQRVLSYLGPLFAVMSVGVNDLWHNYDMTFVIAFATGSLVLMWGYAIKGYFATAAGALLMLVLLFAESADVLLLVMTSGWLGLAIAGVLVIILASLIDRYGAIIRLKWAQRHESLQDWKW